MTSAPEANTSLGRLAGAVEQGVCVFRGVPYAQAPVGALRFAPPPTAGPRAEISHDLKAARTDEAAFNRTPATSTRSPPSSGAE
jgi:carboxylesterase type B